MGEGHADKGLVQHARMALAENAIDHGIDVSENENPTLWLTIREEAEHILDRKSTRLNSSH